MRARLAARDRGLVLENLRSLDAQLARVMAPQKVSALTFSLFSAVALLLFRDRVAEGKTALTQWRQTALLAGAAPY